MREFRAPPAGECLLSRSGHVISLSFFTLCVPSVFVACALPAFLSVASFRYFRTLFVPPHLRVSYRTWNSIQDALFARSKSHPASFSRAQNAARQAFCCLHDGCFGGIRLRISSECHFRAWLMSFCCSQTSSNSLSAPLRNNFSHFNTWTQKCRKNAITESRKFENILSDYVYSLVIIVVFNRQSRQAYKDLKIWVTLIR